MYRDGTIKDYFDDAASGKSAPGGGSVSAFAGALATTMGSMAANFTTGKKKFREVEPQVNAILDSLGTLRAELLELSDEDVTAYSVVSAAYAMPKETVEDKQARTAKIQEALVVAMDVPLRTVRACMKVIDELTSLVDVANPNLISDVGVSAILAEAALRGAKLNVEINLAYLKDAEVVASVGAQVDASASDAKTKCEDIMAKLEAKVKS